MPRKKKALLTDAYMSEMTKLIVSYQMADGEVVRGRSDTTLSFKALGWNDFMDRFRSGRGVTIDSLRKVEEYIRNNSEE